MLLDRNQEPGQNEKPRLRRGLYNLQKFRAIFLDEQRIEPNCLHKLQQLGLLLTCVPVLLVDFLNNPISASKSPSRRRIIHGA